MIPTSKTPLRIDGAAAAPSVVDPTEEVSLVGLVNVVLRYRWLVIVTAVITAGIVVGVTLIRDRTYTATSSFVPQAGRTTPGIAGLAAQFGVNVQPTDGTDSPQFYADLLRSREILRSAVATTYELRSDTGLVQTTLVPVLGRDEPTPARREDAAMRELGRRLGVNVNTRTGVVTVSVRSEHPGLSSQVNARFLALLSDFNLRRRQSQAAAERAFVEQRLAEVRAELRAAERRLEAFYLRNRDYANSPPLRFEQERLAQQVAVQQQLFSGLSQSFEQAKIDEVRDTPVLTVIEPPVVPVRPDSRGLALKGIGGLLAGVALGVLLAFTRHGLARAGDAQSAEYEEFQLLRREALADVTHPWRPLARLFRRRRTA